MTDPADGSPHVSRTRSAAEPDQRRETRSAAEPDQRRETRSAAEPDQCRETRSAAEPDRRSRPGSGGEHAIQEALGTSARADRFYDDQMCDRLLPKMIEFVERMTMAFIATADAHGECDSSLRAGPPGFLQVLDDRHVAYPEYRGNGVLASLGNISENPHIGLLMVDFTDELIGLHVNGPARIVDDTVMRASYTGLPEDTVPGRRADVWVVVEVEEAYIHCRKHIPRLVPADRRRSWGTDDVRRKGGDHFAAATAHRAGEVEAAPTEHTAGDEHLGGRGSEQLPSGAPSGA